MRHRLPSLFMAPLILLAGCAMLPHKPQPPLISARHVDLDSYMGDWFVIAHVPYSGEKGFCSSIQRFLLYPEGQIKTTFLAIKTGPSGQAVSIVTLSQVTNTKTNAEWTIYLPGAFSPSQMTILYVAPDYHYAVVATTDRKHAWILSRIRKMAPADYTSSLLVLKNNGIPSKHLILVPQ